MIADDIARRFEIRDGLRLRCVIQVGLPVYRLRLRAITVLHRAIPPIEEFIIRSIALDIRAASEISAFLGLEDRVLRPAFVSLVESGDISVDAGASGGNFRLTAKGQITSEKHVLISTEERTFAIYFDSLARKTTWFRSEQLIELRELQAKNIREISQYPSVRPRAADLRLTEIDAVVRSLQYSPEVRRDLIAIRGIEACRKAFLPALALIYSGNDQGDLQLGVAIDGKLSPIHEPLVWGSHGFADFVRNTVSNQIRAVTEIDEVRRSNSAQIEKSTKLETAITEAEGEKAELLAKLEEESMPNQQGTLKEGH